MKISVDISEIENCWRDKKWLYEGSTKLMDLYINYVCEKKIQTTGIRYPRKEYTFRLSGIKMIISAYY